MKAVRSLILFGMLLLAGFSPCRAEETPLEEAIFDIFGEPDSTTVSKPVSVESPVPIRGRSRKYEGTPHVYVFADTTVMTLHTEQKNLILLAVVSKKRITDSRVRALKRIFDMVIDDSTIDIAVSPDGTRFAALSEQYSAD